MLVFNGLLFNIATDLADAVAEAWITADGSHPRRLVAEALESASDSDLAAEVLSAWKVPLTEADLTSAFRRYRRAFNNGDR